MFRKTVATAAAITFALALPADALGLGGLGGGLGGRGKGKSTASGNSSSSSSSNSNKSGGVSAGASAGRGGISAGASVGGIGARASVDRSGASVSSSVGSAAGASASVSRSGISTGASVGSVGVDASVSRSGVSATVGAANPSSRSPGQQQQQAQAVPALLATGPTALLLLPLPLALQPGSNRSCIQENGCSAAPQLKEGRASASAPIPASGEKSSESRQKLAERAGTPSSIVSACQLAAVRAAKAYGAVSVEAASAGKFAATASGGGVAPVNLRVTYPGSTGSRQARVACAINSDGVVTGLAV